MIITGLIGYPTDHSISHILFNYFAKSEGLEYAHVKFNILPQKNYLKKALESLPVLNIKGVNITLPYKIKALSYVDWLSSEVEMIGAVNTIVVDGKNKLLGYNTDWYGALKSIEKALGRKVKKTDRVVILGSGGVARALVYGLLKRTKNITVFFRSPISLKTKNFIGDFDKKIKIFNYEPQKHFYEMLCKADIICNATNVGMWPNINNSLISEKIFSALNRNCNLSNKLFFDVIFNPYETLFLQRAKKYGAKIKNGLSMMIYQGVVAFELWTNRKIKKEIIKKVKPILKDYLLHD